jgi:hypothetical protein
MKSQRNQLIILAALIIAWAVSWQLTVNKNRVPAAAPQPAARSAKAASQDSLLKARFRRVRAEMDSLYHYRIKPAPFDAHWNPFRMPAMMLVSTGEKAQAATADNSKNKPVDQSQQTTGTPELDEALLAHAIAGMRIGGVVTLGDTTQLTVDGQLHKEGDVFPTKVRGRLVLIRIRHLSVAAVTLALGDPNQGTAEIRVRLK